MTTCRIKDCSRPRRTKGLCPTHYKRAQRGAALDTPVRVYANDFERFVTKADDGCWMWTGALMGNGYGRYRRPGAPQTAPALLAHRYSYELEHGEIPAGLQLDHLCRTKACVNPAHLEPVTAAENLRRARAATEGARA